MTGRTDVPAAAAEEIRALHDVADVGTNCRDCGEPYPCEIRLLVDKATDMQRRHQDSRRRNAAGLPEGEQQ